MATQRQKFATQADPDLLAGMKAIADTEGRQFQAVVEEAFRDYIERKNGKTPRPEVMRHFNDSLAQYDVLYQKLAQ